jgi:hypothetical protein
METAARRGPFARFEPPMSGSCALRKNEMDSRLHGSDDAGDVRLPGRGQRHTGHTTWVLCASHEYFTGFRLSPE